MSPFLPMVSHSNYWGLCLLFLNLWHFTAPTSSFSDFSLHRGSCSRSHCLLSFSGRRFQIKLAECLQKGSLAPREFVKSTRIAVGWAALSELSGLKSVSCCEAVARVSSLAWLAFCQFICWGFELLFEVASGDLFEMIIAHCSSLKEDLSDLKKGRLSFNL